MARCGCSSRCNCLVISGSNITVTGNGSLADPYVITGLAPYTDEMARDAIGAALVAGSGITLTVNDAGDTITISSTVVSGDSDEQVRDVIGAALRAGTGIVITVDDPGDTLTIASSGTGVKSTVAAGLPSFAGRSQGDLHRNLTDGREYVLFGAPGASVSDNFDRPNSTGLGTSSSGTVWASRGGAAANVVGNVAVGQSGGQNYVPIAAGDQTVSLLYNTAGASTTEVDLVARLDSATGTNYTGILVRASGTFMHMAMTRNGSVLVADTVTTLPYVAGHAYLVTFTVVGQVLTLTATDQTSGATYTMTFTDPGSVLTGINAGWSAQNTAGSVDNFTAFGNGTLAWLQETEPATLTSLGGCKSTVGTGLPPFAGRNQGDFHYDDSTGKEHVLTGVAAAGYVTETFDDPGALNGANTTTGSKVWDADTTVFKSGGTAGAPGSWPGGGSTQKGRINFGASAQDATALFIPDISGGFSAYQVFICNTLIGLSGAPAVDGYRAVLQPSGGPGVYTWTVYENTGNTLLATGGLTGFTGSAKIRLKRTAGGVVTMWINDVQLYTGSPAGVTVGNFSGFGLLGSSSDPRINSFEVGDSGTLKWTYNEPIYLSCVVPGAVTVGTHVFKPGLRVPTGPTTARRLVIRTDTAATAGGITVVGHRYNNGVDTGDTITASIASGANVGSTTAAVDTAAGDMWKFDVTVANGGSDMLIDLDLF